MAMSLVDQYQRKFDFHDGSHYQPDAGPFDPVRLAGASRFTPSVGPILSWKSTQSVSYTDPTFEQYRDQFNALFDIVVWYHWISSVTDVSKQVDHALAKLGTRRPGERMSMDGEEWDRAQEDAHPGITEARYLQYLEGVEDETHEPTTVYSGIYVAYGTIWRSEAIRNSKYGIRPMHLAAYISRDSLIFRLQQLGIIDLPIHIWQYSSNGDYIPGVPMTLPGVTGRGDMNHVCDWSVYRSPAPQPTPPVQTDVQEDLVYISNNAKMTIDGQDFDPGHVWVEMLQGGRARHVTDFNEVKAALGESPDPVTRLDVQRSPSLLNSLNYAEMAPTPTPSPVVQFPRYAGDLASVPGKLLLTPEA